jgi:hypothetical protein
VIILIVTAAAVIAALFYGAILLVRSSRMAQTHLVPDGYKGWVSVAYGVDGAPPLPVEDGHRVFRYDARGKLETSSEYAEGWGVDDFFYVAGETRQLLRLRPSGMEGEIWGAHTRSSVVTRFGGKVTREGVSTGFFVGTEEEWRAYRRP